MTARRPLVPGVYDAPVTAALQGSLSSLPPDLHETEPLDPADSPRTLARLIHGRLVHALAAFSSSRDDALTRQLELTNRVLAVLEDVPGSGASADDHVVPPGARLLAVRDPAATARPEIPLATSDLLVNGRHDVSLGPEVNRELASTDRLDLLCPFLKSRKDCLTVLDFIGGAHRRFRFDLRYRAIVGGTRRSVKSEIERGFPSLPSGCVIQLDRVSQQAVLENVEHALGLGKRALVEDLRELGDVDLATFLRETGAELEDVYAGGTPAWTFTRMRREAGFEKAELESAEDQQVSRALSRLLHVDDTERLNGLLSLVSRSAPPAPDAGDAMQRWLFVLLGWVRHSYAGMDQAWAHLWSRPALRRELAQLLAVLADRSRWLGGRLGGALGDLPLLTHVTYTLDEVLAGIDERSDKGGVKRIQTGVFHVPRRSTELLFITLEKSEKHYTPTTLYDDYPISPTRFHWESQSIAHEDAPTGRRYISARPGAKNNVLLFVRQRRTGDRGETMPYVHLGRGFYRSHRGARPMQIEWDLETPMPAWLYQETKRAAG
ncbi:DUF3427 domain-containing protein [Sandaracinus amylolyticus]|uniref:DUF3427 domain-containing protein n=1 Tax=Sandaracinus amylolyticus TaxID=927083 RepID=UPI001F199F9A|nr:DUF3427 domain-containing protein [Sandaracinus amylolyticus]UJR86680.1 Hypothetical protein I5071_87810 [Sandaracinus amylolyticus]